MDLVNFSKEMWDMALDGNAQGVWFFAALYTLAICSYSVIFQIRTRSWPFTEGSLIDAGVDKFGTTLSSLSDQDYTANTLYEYSVVGQRYAGKRVSPWVIVASHNARGILRNQIAKIQQLPNKKVRVYYNPANPKKSFLIIASKTGIVITCIIALLPLVLFYWRYEL
jgi:hypothetical protein